ncbi:MAG TPA: hypothetical protein VLA14_10320, partial [Polyangia bacterium]|nr:hypothetical protein [Polyangia bacterium]
MTTRAPARRVLLGVVSFAVAIGVVTGAAALRAANSPGAQTPPAASEPVAASPGYVLLDLPAIQRAVHGHG